VWYKINNIPVRRKGNIGFEISENTSGERRS
jgi:hypothetical protein